MISDTTKVYEYDAFISYSHLDQKAAVAIQHKLERYRIPKAIREKRIHTSAQLKVFLDETDLSAGNLEKNIDQFLDKSAKLIVICSSVPAIDGKEKYKWVTQEVQHFIDTGRIDDILPIVLDGDWDTLPPNIKALSDRQFIADVTVLGKRIAFLKILSAVLGTDFDALVRRANVHRRWKRSIFAFCSLLFVSLFHYYFMPHTTYYADYTIRFGLPEGVEKLNRAQRSARGEVYAITTWRSKHEIRLEHMNSSGTLTEDTSLNHIDPPTAALYECFNDWSINTVTYFDNNEKQIYSYVYAPDLSYMDLIRSKEDAQWLTRAAGRNEYNLPVRTNISRYNLEFDSEGRLSHRLYAVDRLSSVNEDGVGGEAYTYDDFGRITGICYVDVDGSPVANKHGIAKTGLCYDNCRRNYRVEYYNADGELINNPAWYAVMERQYDNADNVSEIRYYNAKGELTITSDGYAVTKMSYDKNGFLTSCSYHGKEDEAVYNISGFHKITFAYDKKGRDTENAYLDTEGRLILMSEGYAKCKKQYNKKGLLEEQFYYNENDEPNLCDIGAHQVQCEYDRHGNPTRIAYYGPDGELAFTTLGYASMRLEYNVMDLQTNQSYYGIHNEKILGKEGYHKQEFKYDNRNNIETILYTGLAGQPALCSSGYASRKLEYDNAGNILKDSYLDDYNEPTYISDYFATAVMEYDERGNQTSIELLGPDGTPSKDSIYSKKEISYDSIGRIKEESFYLEGHPIGKNIYQYTDNGLISSKTAQNADGTIKSQTLYTYDERGNELEITEMKETSVTGRTVREFNDRNQITKNAYYDSDNKLLRYYTVDFNANGMPVKTSYFGSDGKLSRDANLSEHVAVVTADYDDRNRKIDRRCYDENDHLLRILENGQYTYAGLKVIYTKGCKETFFYDENETVYQRTVEEYDEYDRLVNRIYCDGDGNQLVRHEVSYNERGRVTSDALYNGQDELQADETSGVAKILYFYDDYDYMIGEEFYDKSNKLIAPYSLFAKYTSVRENGRTTEIRYYGTDGELALNQDGYAIERFTYNDRGYETGRAFYDTDDNPVLLKWRFSRYDVTYDEFGNIQESKFFDTSDREVKQVDGKLEQAEALIDGFPQKILMFYGNDGSSLMGQIEMKIKVPLEERVEHQTDSPPEDETPKEEPVPDTVDKNSVEEAKTDFSDRDYINSVNDYVRAIERFDGMELMAATDQNFLIDILVKSIRQKDATLSANKLYHIYVSFYDKELASLKESLSEKYGTDLYITYEILSEECLSKDMIQTVNAAMKELGADDYNIQQIVSLGITYTVTGSQTQGVEDTLFFSQPLVLYQVDDEWTVSLGNDVPKPSVNEIRKAL